MRKITATLLAILLLAVTLTAAAETSFWFDRNHNLYLVCACDEETDRPFTAVCTLVELADIIEHCPVCSAYIIDCDGIGEINWAIGSDCFVTSNMFGEIIDILWWQ